jgi:copper chaperone CopZ
MKQSFEVFNVKCSGCASTLKSRLAKEFGKIEVNLEVLPRKITLDMKNKDVDKLSKALRELGYPLAEEEMSFMDSTSAKAKSFVSCAIGKMNS